MRHRGPITSIGCVICSDVSGVPNRDDGNENLPLTMCVIIGVSRQHHGERPPEHTSKVRFEALPAELKPDILLN